MRLPPKPILIRIVIYGSLIGFFGWRAMVRFSEQRQAEAAAESEKEKKGSATRAMKLGDGSEIPVMELTPEEAQREFGVKLEGAPEAPPPDLGAAEPDPDPDPEPRVNPRLIPPGSELK